VNLKREENESERRSAGKEEAKMGSGMRVPESRRGVEAIESKEKRIQ